MWAGHHRQRTFRDSAKQNERCPKNFGGVFMIRPTWSCVLSDACEIWTQRWLGLHVRLVFGLFDWRLASSTGIPSPLVWASPRTPWIWLTSCRRSGITLERHNIIINMRTAAIVNDKNLWAAQKKQQVPAHDYRRRATAVTSEEGRWKIPGKHLDLVVSSVKIPKNVHTLGLSDTSDIIDTIL